MMITFQRQIESVGLHRALISRACISDFTQTAAAAGGGVEGGGGGGGDGLRADRHGGRRPGRVHSLGAPGKQ